MAMTNDQSGASHMEESGKNRFPAGLRVLAVDDDPMCLKVLENLLHKCQYKVTTTTQSIKALEMLREDNNKYDLVITNVKMPEMDGFKLLELIGLEMGLPVVLLSEHCNTELVMRGITHGACDYLCKPVRIEELMNIWQHVLRRKKFVPALQNKLPSPETERNNAINGQGSSSAAGNANQNGCASDNKRKHVDQEDGNDQGEAEEGEDNEEDESEDSSSQKRPRVVWSVELHGKFVEAVNTLSLSKAVPKKILDLMNVEGLTRENIASHLQKYRLYLKRLSRDVPQENIIATFGSTDSGHLLGTLNGYGSYSALSSTARFSNNALPSSSYPNARLNSSPGINLHGITGSSLIQPTPTLSNSLNRSSSGFNSHGIAGSSLIQPIPYLSNIATSSTNRVSHLYQGNSTSFQAGQSNGYPFTVGGSSSNNSIPMNSAGRSNLFRTGANMSWQVGGVQSPTYSSMQDTFLNNNNNNNTLATGFLHGNSSFEFPSSRSLASSSNSGLVGNPFMNPNYTTTQKWGEQVQDHYNGNQNFTFNAMNTLGSANAAMVPSNHNKSGFTGQTNNPSTLTSSQYGFHRTEQTKAPNSIIKKNFDTLDDIVNSLSQGQKNNETTLMDDEDFSFDTYSLGGSGL